MIEKIESFVLGICIGCVPLIFLFNTQNWISTLISLCAYTYVCARITLIFQVKFRLIEISLLFISMFLFPSYLVFHETNNVPAMSAFLLAYTITIGRLSYLTYFAKHVTKQH